MSFGNWFKGAKAKAFVVLGSFAMLLGVGASVSAVAATQENEVVEAKAATGAANSDVYLNLLDGQCTWDDSGEYWFVCKDSSGNDGNWYQFTETVTPVGSSDSIYHLTIPVAYAKFCVLRRNNGNTETWGYTGDYTSSSVSDQNVIKIYNYGSGQYTYSALDSSAYNVYSFSASATNGTAKVSTSEGSQNQTSGYLYAHYLYQVTGSPSTNYKFNSWSITGSTTAYGGTTVSNQTYKFYPGANLTITTTYTYITHNVTFNPKGGTFASDGSAENKVIAVNQGSTVSSQTVTRVGYVFQRWSETDGGSTPFDFSTAITSAKTLYAVWSTASTYTFKVDYGPIADTWGSGAPNIYIWTGKAINAVGGVPASDSGSDSIYGDIYQFTVPQNADGFVIANTSWSYKTGDITDFSTHSGHTYVITATTSTVDSDARICNGSWFSSMLTLTTNEDGTQRTYSFYSGIDLRLPSIASKSGYAAEAWNTDSSGTGTYYGESSIHSFTSNTTLYSTYITAGYYVVGNAAFSHTSTLTWSAFTGQKMTSAPTGDDKAAGKGISVASGSIMAIVHLIENDDDEWFHSWGGWPADCAVVDDPTLGSGTDDLEYSGGSTASFDFYINASDVIYVVDEKAVSDAGYLYYASDDDADDITLIASNGDPTPTISGHLEDVSGLVSAPAALSFGGKAHLYKISVYNLRGIVTSKKVTSITIAGAVVSLAGLSQTDGAENYINGTSLQPYGAVAADIAWTLATAIGTADSLCAVDPDTLSAFKSSYVGLTDSTAKSLLNNATIYTYTPDGNSYDPSSGPKITTKKNVTIKTIYNYVNDHYNVSTGKWSVSVFGPAGQAESSPLTLTLWIVLGAGIAGMGAIGAAYFVSKKKKRPQA